MAKIEDGTGTSAQLKVNSNNQALVYAESKPSEGVQAEVGNAFIVHCEAHLAAAASGGFLSITNNDQDANLEVTRIYIDPHVLTNNIVVTQVFDPTLIGGTDISTTACIQKNRGSAEEFDLNILCSDGSADLTYTGGTQYHAFPIKSMTSQQRNMNSTNVLAKGTTILFGWKTVDGSNAVDGEVVSFSVNIVKREI